MSRRGLSNRGLAELIRRYYRRRPLKEPVYFPKREIALQPLGAKSYVRHLSFPSIITLYHYIDENPPLHLYYSSAIYDNPGAEDMESKEWLGSELIFDIDSDHYEGCGDAVSVCLDCGEVIEGKARSCPRCGSKNLAVIPLLGEECLRRAWHDAVRLYDILREEYGFSQVYLEFSGNRGFHIRVTDEEVLPMTRDERRLVADYVRLNMFRLEQLVYPYREHGARLAVFLKRGEIGVRRRILREALRLLDHEERGEVYVFNYNDLEVIIGDLAIDIDAVVTMDPTRLSRFVGSINGKAGLRVDELSPNTDPEEIVFEKFRAFGGYVKARHLYNLPETRILWARIGLRKGYVGKMDAAIAFYLAVRGLVEIIDASGVEYLSSRET